MINPNIGKPCSYDQLVQCFNPLPCDSSSLLDCLKANLYYALRENEHLKSVKLAQHTKISLKWREQAFYYKKRLRLTLQWMEKHQFPIPTTEDLFGKPTSTTTLVQKEKEDTP